MTAITEVERLDLGRVARETWRIVRAQFAGLFVLSFGVTGLPVAVLQSMQTQSFQNGTGILWPSTWFLLGSLVTGAIATGAMTYAAAQVLRGERTSLGDLATAGLRHFPVMLGTSTVAIFMTTLGAVALVLSGLLIACAWFVWAPVVMLERLTVFKALNRSQELTRNNRLLIALLTILYLVVATTLSAAVDALTGGLGVLSQNLVAANTGPVAICGTAVVTALNTLVASVGVTVVYGELRRIRDGAGPFGGIAQVFD